MREIADMSARALDDFAIGVDQRVGLARQRRDLHRKFALQPLGASRADRGKRIRNALERCETEPHLEDRGEHQHQRQGQECAAEIVVEGAGLIENLAGIARDRDQEFPVGTEINLALDDAQALIFRTCLLYTSRCV